MTHRKIRCLTRTPITEDTKPCHRWRFSNQTKCGSDFEVREHRVPSFLTLHAHLIIEETLENVTNKLLPQPFSKITLLFYHIFHGFIAGYRMKEIYIFWHQADLLIQNERTFSLFSQTLSKTEHFLKHKFMVRNPLTFQKIYCFCRSFTAPEMHTQHTTFYHSSNIFNQKNDSPKIPQKETSTTTKKMLIITQTMRSHQPNFLKIFLTATHQNKSEKMKIKKGGETQ
jgi:hypothetical protein